MNVADKYYKVQQLANFIAIESMVLFMILPICIVIISIDLSLFLFIFEYFKRTHIRIQIC